MRNMVRTSVGSAIGILDSGLGGLTVWQKIRYQLPQEPTIYIGDHAYQPYGKRSARQIRQRVNHLITFLLGKGAKLVVVACNSATVAGIDIYRRWFPGVSIIGVVPVVKTAAAMTTTKHVAVISTPYTAASRYQKRLIDTFAQGCHVENIGIPDLASLIEAGHTNRTAKALLHRFLDPLKTMSIDVIALGCTHYPFVKDTIQDIVGDDVTVIDSAGAVARHTARILEANKLQADVGMPYTVFYTTGNAKNITVVARKLTGEPIKFIYARV